MDLKYIGDGSFLPGVPARDLSEKEVKEFDEQVLLNSGLYVRSAVYDRKMDTPVVENKMVRPKPHQKEGDQ